ncbi:hypothetical protein B296_00017992 [Ensete ventricosum]|uniref:Uncharacterized protein n=1 Tax=Ensete ventricosum TaxID=4639 RepID=A0A426YA78_ENSVE|nr:hypothetical protein B296_00017992 [Ensete ventricosum]
MCASSPAIVSSGEEVEHGWVEGALEFSSGGRRLMPWSSGQEFTLAARVALERRSVGSTIGSGGRDGRGERLLWQGRKKGTTDEGGEEEGATVTGEGAAEEEVTAATRATVGEVSCGREGRKVRMWMQLRLWLRRKGNGGRRPGREAVVERMGSDCHFLLFFFFLSLSWKSYVQDVGNIYVYRFKPYQKVVLVIPIPFQDREGGDRLSSSFQGKLVGSDGDVFVVYYNTDWKSTAATAEGFQGEEVGTVASRSECEQLGRSYLIHRSLPGRGVSVSEMKPALESELQKADCIYYRRHIKDNLRRYCMQTGRPIEVAGLNMASDLVGWFTPETRTGGV